MAFMAARWTRFWFPFAMALVVICGVSYSAVVKAQSPLSAFAQPTSYDNAIDIAVMKGDIKELKELQTENMALQLKVERLENKTLEQSVKIDGIAADERWATLGIIGIFAMKIFDRLKFLGSGGKSTDDKDHDSGTVKTYSRR